MMSGSDMKGSDMMMSGSDMQADCEGETPIPVKTGGCRACTDKDLEATNKDGTPKYPQCSGSDASDDAEPAQCTTLLCPAGWVRDDTAVCAGVKCDLNVDEDTCCTQECVERVTFSTNGK